MKKTIDTFIADKKLAIVGVSRVKERMGSMFFNELSKKGYDLYPINKKYPDIEGKKCYASVKDLPADVKNVIIAVRPSNADAVVKDILNSKIERVWFHKGAGGPGSMTSAALAACKEKGIEVVYGVCPMMFYPPTGFHGFHRWLRKVSGGMPKELKL